MSQSRGFTLIELLIVVVILAVIASVGLVVYTPLREKARDSVRKQDLNNLAVALELYLQKNYKYVEGSGSCTTDTDRFYTEISPLMQDGRVPVDPSSGERYCYLSVNNGASYILYAKLEDCSDPEILDSASCQTASYNYQLAAKQQDLAEAPPPPLAGVPPIFVNEPTTNSCEVVIDTVLDVYTSLDTICQ